MRENAFEATVDFQRLDEPDVIIICVPTPLTEARDPDLTYIVNSTKAIAERLRPGQLVVLESTTYPGTTREVVLPLLDGHGTEDPVSTSSWPSVPSAKTPAILSSRLRPSPRSSAASIRPASSSPSPSTARSSSGSCPSPARKSPRPAKSSKTPTAPSISRWLTS